MPLLVTNPSPTHENVHLARPSSPRRTSTLFINGTMGDGTPDDSHTTGQRGARDDGGAGRPAGLRADRKASCGGRRISLLHEGREHPAAPRDVEWSASSVAAGVYLIRAEGKTFTRTQRVVVVR